MENKIALMNLLSLLQQLNPKITTGSQNEEMVFPLPNGFGIDRTVDHQVFELRKDPEEPGHPNLVCFGIFVSMFSCEGRQFYQYVHRFPDPQKDLLFFVVIVESDHSIKMTRWSTR